MFLGSIRINLLFVALSAFLPLLVVIVVSGYHMRTDELHEIEVEAKRLVLSFAERQEKLTLSLRQTMATLALTQEVQDKDSQQCGNLFEKLTQLNPLHTSISLLDPDGRIIACGLQGISMSERFLDARQVQLVREKLEFSAGEYSRDPLTGTPVFSFAYPVLGPEGKLVSILNLTLDLNIYPNLFEAERMPDSTVLSVFDRNGLLLCDVPQSPDLALGGKAREEVWNGYVNGGEHGISRHQDVLGIARLNVYKKLYLGSSSEPYMTIVVGIPEEAALTKADRITTRYLAWLLLAVFVSLYIAYWVAKIGIINRLEDLSVMAKRLRSGDHSARSGISQSGGKLGEVGRAFDDLAHAIMEREAQRDQAWQDLKLSRDQLELVFDTAGNGMRVVSKKFKVKRVNSSFAKMTGLSHEEQFDMPCYENFPGPHCHTELCTLRRILAGEQRVEIESVKNRKDGKQSLYLIIATPYRGPDNEIAGMVESFHDISQRKQFEEQLRQMAITDELTQIFNRRHFLTLAGQEFEKSRRYRRPLAMLMLDIDNFKNINDIYGHDVGDMVLKLLSATCEEAIRETDVFARFGGEEFVAILPETGAQQALQLAQRILEAVRVLSVEAGETRIGLTVSVGMTTFDDADVSLEEMIKRADQALYVAKRAGKDRVRAVFR